MRLRSPSEFYIKGLLVHPDLLSNKDIIERLQDEGLDYISEGYIQRLRERMAPPPEPFYPRDSRHAPSFRYIAKERILRMFLVDTDMRAALDILERPRIKEYIESMMQFRPPNTLLAAFIERKYGCPCTSRALELYFHFFWNLDLLDSTQLRALIQLRYEQAKGDEAGAFKGMAKVLDRAYYRDPRRVASELPANEMSMQIVATHLGYMPTKQTFVGTLNAAREKLAIKIVEAASSDSLQDSQKAVNFANAARLVIDMIESSGAPEDKMQENLRKFVLQSQTKKLPSIHELSQGQHTVDVVPLENKQDEPESEPESDGARRRTGAGE